MENEMNGKNGIRLEIQGWLVRILRRMFREVGEVFDEDYVQADGWYLRHSWTKQKEEEFAIWMKQQLKKQHPWKYRPDRLIDDEIGYFLLNYGWKTEDK
jgi:hypothetical protein